jgi:hypothetical protein
MELLNAVDDTEGSRQHCALRGVIDCDVFLYLKGYWRTHTHTHTQQRGTQLVFTLRYSICLPCVEVSDRS